MEITFNTNSVEFFFSIYLVMLCLFWAWIIDSLSISQLKEENSVYGSDEEVDDPPEVDSDEDFSDDGDKQVLEEV